MEDSKVKAQYVYYCDSDIDPIDVYNITDLSEYVKEYNFGDLVAFSDYRDTQTFFIGKEGKLIPNPDYSDSGYLTVPYEITQYLDNAVYKFNDLDPMFIDLRYDDKFIKENINTTSCKIPKDWKITFSSYYDLGVTFPDGTEHNFKVDKTSAYKIKKWYESSKEEQYQLKLYVEYEKSSYEEPNIPSTSTFYYTGGGSCSKDDKGYFYSKYEIKGPVKDRERVLKSIKKFYKNLEYKIT